MSLLSACGTLQSKPANLPSESSTIPKIVCIPAPHAMDTELLSYGGFSLHAEKSLLIWSGPSQREDSAQTVTGHVHLKFTGPGIIHMNEERDVTGGLSVIPGGEQILLDARTIGPWAIQISLILRGKDDYSVMTLIRKIKSGKVTGTETYRFAARCSQPSS